MVETVTAYFTRPANTTAYAAGDGVTNSTSAPTLMSFNLQNDYSDKGAYIFNAQLIDESDPTTDGQFKLWLFTTSVTPPNDNAAWTPTAAHLRSCVAVIPFYTPDAASTTGNVYQDNGAYGFGLPSRFASTPVSTIYGLLVAQNAYTPASAGRFNVKLSISGGPRL